MNYSCFQCHVCRAQEHAHLYRKPAESYLEWDQAFDIVQCSRCGMVSVENQPQMEELVEIYDRVFFDTAQQKVMSSAAIKNAERRVSLLQHYRDRGILLDVGCGTGNFLHVASQVYESIGIDVSGYAVAHGRKTFDLDLREGDLVNYEFDGETFDLITMWDFIAHVPEPVAYLTKARQLLKPGGFLFLTTGDISSACARLSGKYWHLMIPPKHLHFFSSSTIRLALESSGFQVCAILWPGKRVPIDFMWTKFMRILNLTRFEQKRWPKWLPQELYVNLFDIMTVVARAE